MCLCAWCVHSQFCKTCNCVFSKVREATRLVSVNVQTKPKVAGSLSSALHLFRQVCVYEGGPRIGGFRSKKYGFCDPFGMI